MVRALGETVFYKLSVSDLDIAELLNRKKEFLYLPLRRQRCSSLVEEKLLCLCRMWRRGCLLSMMENSL